jgi:hypothetical protein
MTARKAGMAALALFGLMALAMPAFAQTSDASGTEALTAVPISAPAETAVLPTSQASDSLDAGKCTVNGKLVPCAQVMKQLGGYAGAAIGFFVVWIALLLAGTVFWLLMLIHAATHPIQNRPLWILVIVFVNVIGAIVYYFAVKRPFDKMARAALGTGPAAVNPTTGMPSPIAPPVSPQLAEYVRTSRQQGVADDATRQSLVAAGWNAADVDRALKS